ncbi:mitochondrial carrier domain-containing protein [Kalaharituber pfeilii]|nr:mitochondrial carrier domain-containing protein [Kalaharituber pfeilii]
MHANKGTKSHVAIAGSVAGLVSRFVIAPLDVVKIRLQLQHHASVITSTVQFAPSAHAPLQPVTNLGPSPVYRGIISTIRTIVVQEGFTALWKGNIPAELLYLTYGASQFLAFRQVTRLVSASGLDVPDPAKNFAGGAVAGSVATTVTYPFDLLRTRFASQGTQKIYKSLLGSVQHIYKHEGPKGFFRGLEAGLIQIIPYMGIFFCTYESTRSLLTPHHQSIPSGWPDAIAGTIAAVVSKTGVFPLDLIRKRLQVQGPTRELYVHRNIPIYNGIWQTAKTTVQCEGFRGLYRGLAVALLKAAPASAVTMWTFEQTMRFLKWKDGIED